MAGEAPGRARKIMQFAPRPGTAGRTAAQSAPYTR